MSARCLLIRPPEEEVMSLTGFKTAMKRVLCLAMAAAVPAPAVAAAPAPARTLQHVG